MYLIKIEIQISKKKLQKKEELANTSVNNLRKKNTNGIETILGRETIHNAEKPCTISLCPVTEFY